MKNLPFLVLMAVSQAIGTDPVSADAPPPKPRVPAAVDSSPWARRLPLSGAISEEGLHCVEIDPRVYRHSDIPFSTLRLVREQEGILTEEPWVMRRVPTPKRPAPPAFTHQIESFEEKADGSIELVASLSLPVSVPDGEGGWRVLLGDGVIFDRSRFLDFRRTSLDLPKTEARRFLLRITEATDTQRSRLREITRTVGDSTGLTITEKSQAEERPFRIDALHFTALSPKIAASGAPDRSFVLELLASDSPAEGIDHLEFDGGHLPLERLHFTTQDRNFRRAVTLQVPAGEGWRTLHQGHLHRYEVGDFRDESLALAFPETRAPRYRLVVANGALPPVNFTGVRGQGPLHELCFLAAPGDRLKLLLDAEEAPPHRFDAAALHAAIARGVPARRLELGEMVSNPHFKGPLTDPPPGILESKAALWTGIALAVAVLIWVIYGSLKKVEEVTP